MKINIKKKKNAFTLTELLIVIVVIASLSAIAIPQYQRVLEDRKVGEAESVLSYVRVRQELRCIKGKAYASDVSDMFPPSNNFTYSASGETLTATAKNANYALKIASYRDGRIYCEGSDCSRFSYPTSLSNVASGAECLAAAAAPATEHTPTPTGGSSGFCEFTETTETANCSALSDAGDYKTGTASRVKTKHTDCTETYTSWDISQCSVSRTNQACSCQQYGGSYTQGGNAALCSYTQYGDGHIVGVTVTSAANCTKNTTGSCSCSQFSSTYNTGTISCSYTEKQNGTKSDYVPSDLSGCYKQSTKNVQCSDFANFGYEIASGTSFNGASYLGASGSASYTLTEYYDGRKVASSFNVSSCKRLKWECATTGGTDGGGWTCETAVCTYVSPNLINNETCSTQGANATEVNPNDQSAFVHCDGQVCRRSCTCKNTL